MSQALAAQPSASTHCWQQDDASVVLVLYVAPEDVLCEYDRPNCSDVSDAPAAEMRAEGAQRASCVVVDVDVEFLPQWSGAVASAVAMAYAVPPVEVLVTVACVNAVKRVYVLVASAGTKV